MTTKRLYRVKYLAKDTEDTIWRGRLVRGELTVEVVHAVAACVVGEKCAMRVCREAGDRKFARVTSVKEIGAVSRG